MVIDACGDTVDNTAPVTAASAVCSLLETDDDLHLVQIGLSRSADEHAGLPVECTANQTRLRCRKLNLRILVKPAMYLGWHYNELRH